MIILDPVILVCILSGSAANERLALSAAANAPLTLVQTFRKTTRTLALLTAMEPR